MAQRRRLRRAPTEGPLLPDPFAAWFTRRGWAPRAHQLELLDKARAGRSALLVAPTGAGKTLAGFLPTLVELAGLSPSPLCGGGWPSRERGPGGGVGAPGGGGGGGGGGECARSPPPSPASLRSAPPPAEGGG